jgi:multidrug efflux pump subunit AcrA (membrane-fusion protein)
LGGEKVQGTLNALGLQSNQENEKFSSTNTSLNTNSPFNVGFQVEVGNLVSDKKELLRSGFSATTTFVVHEYKDVDTLPQSAVHFSETETYVMVYEGPKMPSKKITVKTGGSDSSYVQILSGLKPGDKVLMTTSEESNDS